MDELISNLASKTKLYVCVVCVFSKKADLVITIFQSLGTLAMYQHLHHITRFLKS